MGDESCHATCTACGADAGLKLDAYVWLGVPVAVLKTTTEKDVLPVASPRRCQRNDEAEPCGTYFIVNDYLPKPVALIDSEGRLAGSGDYDVFGRVNEVTVSQDTPAAAGTPPQPFGAYLPSQNLVLAYLKQPAASASLAVQLRVRYAAINTGSAGDFTWVEDGTTGAALTPAYKGWVLGEKTTPWLPVGAAGLVHVRWQSDGVGEPATYSGVTVMGQIFTAKDIANLGVAFVAAALDSNEDGEVDHEDMAKLANDILTPVPGMPTIAEQREALFPSVEPSPSDRL